MFPGVNFARPAGISPAGAAAKEPNVTIVALDDILAWPERDAKGVRMLGSFVLRTGARMYQFYQTISKFKAGTESEGDEDAITNKQKVETEIPGDSLEANEFLATWMGVNVVIIFGSCSDSFQKVYGTKCAPLQLKPSSQDDNEARKKMLVFEQLAKSTWFPGHYTGTLVLSAPFAPATAVFAINAANGNQYQIPALAVTAAIAPSALDLPAGQVVTLIGGGGAGPATLAQTIAGSTKVLLKSGSTWTALVGAVIQLQVFDAGADKYLIELSRS
jgi:hypothetical protein